MASPPYRSPATSPPYPHHIPLPNPKKRPSLSLTSHPPPKKRRKPSSLAASTPSSSHPLRQTSFPPEGSAIDLGARSPSVESDVTGVTGITGGRSVSIAGTAKGSKRKGKGKRGEDGESVKKGKDGKGGADTVADDAADDEEEEEGAEGIEGEDEADQEQERKQLAILVEAFNKSQADRYDSFRRVKLKKEVVRKIVNQTLSQSVPPSVITSINAYTKIFIGHLIERARDVQEQYASLPSPPPSSIELPSSQSTVARSSPYHQDGGFKHDYIKAELSPYGPLDIETNPFAQLKQYASSSSPPPFPFKPSPSSPSALSPPNKPNASNDTASPTTAEKKKHTQHHLGPFLPDHLREAMRRYKRAGEGGGVGMGGMSLVGMGVPGVGSARLGGRRLFK